MMAEIHGAAAIAAVDEAKPAELRPGEGTFVPSVRPDDASGTCSGVRPSTTVAEAYEQPHRSSSEEGEDRGRDGRDDAPLRQRDVDAVDVQALLATEGGEGAGQRLLGLEGRHHGDARSIRPSSSSSPPRGRSSDGLGEELDCDSCGNAVPLEQAGVRDGRGRPHLDALRSAARSRRSTSATRSPGSTASSSPKARPSSDED